MIIECDTEKRWEQGMPHHPKSVEIYEFISDIDIHDCMCWKSGGDGDNGEELMYQLDVYFECQEANDDSIYII